MNDITARIESIAEEMKAQHIEALEAETAGYKFSQDELRARFENLKRLNSEMGRAQFDMVNSPVWQYMDEGDRQAILGFIDDTIRGRDMIKEAMGESPEAP